VSSTVINKITTLNLSINGQTNLSSDNTNFIILYLTILNNLFYRIFYFTIEIVSIYSTITAKYITSRFQ